MTVRWEWERPDGVLPHVELTAQARADHAVLASTSEAAEVYAESVDGDRIVSEATVTLHGVPGPAALAALRTP